MRPRFQWDAYDRAEYQLSFLNNDPYKSIVQMVGCNRHGMTLQQILDNCRVKMNPENLLLAVGDLHQQGFLSIHTVYTSEWSGNAFGPKVDYYKVNWSVIKAINNAIKRLP